VRSLSLVLSTLVIASLVSCGGGDQRFSAAVFGDIPYGTGPTDTSEFLAFPAYVKSINADPDISLALHAGDIHSGKEFCTEAYDVSIFNILKTLTAPLVYTPGDNEWADCHKIKQGGGSFNANTGAVDFVRDANGNLADYFGGDPVANLALVRSIFFTAPGRTMGGAMAVHTQAQEFDPAFPTDSQYVENVWFIRSGVLFAAVNVPGGSNNGTDPWYGAPSMSPAQAQEVANRTGAAQRWLKTAFDRATSENVSSIVLMEQADMWDLDGVASSHIAQYKPYIDTIAARTATFGKPVLLINGDSHIYRSDNPLVKGAPCLIEPSSGVAAIGCTDDAFNNQPNGYNVPNFHRLVVHGSTTPLEWLKLTVDPGTSNTGPTAFGPFSWQRKPQ